MENNSLASCSLEDVPEAVREAVLVAGAATFLSLAILKYQDQIMEMSGQVTQPIKNALGESFCKILDCLGDIKSMENNWTVRAAVLCTEYLQVHQNFKSRFRL